MRHWILGACLPFLFVWLVTQLFSTTLYNWEWDPVIEDYVIASGTVHFHRKEGWGKTLVGEHGIYAVPDAVSLEYPKVIFWGDSFVQGFQVDDKDKLAQQFSRIWNEKHEETLSGIGIGTGERDCADYYFLMPKYEELLKPVYCHVIILPDLTDTFPDGSTTRFQFVSQPEFHLRADDPTPPVNNPGLIALAKRFRMDAFFRLAAETKNKIERLRIQPGPVQQKSTSQTLPDRTIPFYSQAWDFLLTELKEQTQAPILFVYSPGIPTLQKGEIITTDPHAELFSIFSSLCLQHDIDTIDLTPRFVEFFQETNRFPRGFMNSNPYEGHFNQRGHELAAEAVCEHLETAQHAVHPN